MISNKSTAELGLDDRGKTEAFKLELGIDSYFKNRFNSDSQELESIITYNPIQPVAIPLNLFQFNINLGLHC